MAQSGFLFLARAMLELIFSLSDTPRIVDVTLVQVCARSPRGPVANREPQAL